MRLAGHPPPVALWSSTMLTPPVGLPLGVVPARSGGRCQVALPPGWALLLYTDGLIEARDPDHRRLPLDRRSAGLSWPSSAHASRAELPARLVERAEAYNGGPLLDDVAILLLVGP